MTPDQKQILKKRWTALCTKNYETIGDSGSCVLGAGLAENGKIIISSWDVCRCQGNMTWETGLEALISDFNKEFGTSVYYEYGNMD